MKVVEFPVEIWDSIADGTGIDGSSLGFLPTNQRDMKLVPDMGTFEVLPWAPRVGRLICDIMDNDNNPHPLCPRVY